MGKKGNKWVWKENTLEELAAQGIHISQGSERGKADFDLDLALD
jgi:hypothetical protein